MCLRLHARWKQILALWLDTTAASLIWSWQQNCPKRHLSRPPGVLAASTHRVPAFAVCYMRKGKILNLLYDLRNRCEKS